MRKIRHTIAAFLVMALTPMFSFASALPSLNFISYAIAEAGTFGKEVAKLNVELVAMSGTSATSTAIKSDLISEGHGFRQKSAFDHGIQNTQSLT